MSELKLCPFCGGKAKFVHIFENPEKCMVSCRECDGGIDAVFASEDAAEEAWNRRAQPANGKVRPIDANTLSDEISSLQIFLAGESLFTPAIKETVLRTIDEQATIIRA